MDNGWREMRGADYHDAAHAGRPVLLYGTPRYGPTGERHAIGHFETGRGWRESNSDRPFAPKCWQPLPGISRGGGE